MEWLRGRRTRLRIFPGLSVGNREARADCQGGELIDRVAPGAPVRKLLFVESLGDARMPFADCRPDHRAGDAVGLLGRPADLGYARQ